MTCLKKRASTFHLISNRIQNSNITDKKIPGFLSCHSTHVSLSLSSFHLFLPIDKTTTPHPQTLKFFSTPFFSVIKAITAPILLHIRRFAYVFFFFIFSSRYTDLRLLFADVDLFFHIRLHSPLFHVFQQSFRSMKLLVIFQIWCCHQPTLLWLSIIPRIWRFKVFSLPFLLRSDIFICYC